MIVHSILTKYPYHFYAYGSRVKQQAKQYSDLDICYQEPIPWSTLSHLKEDFENSNLPFKVDLIAWDWMDENFQKLIEKDLVLLN